MYSFYNLFLYLFDLYARLIYICNVIKLKYIRTDQYIYFKITNIFSKYNNLNVTNNFLMKKQFEFPSNEIFCFEWIFDNIKYKQYLYNNTLQYLVPYTFYNMRHKRPDHKIIAGILTNNITNQLENCTSDIKQIAGPNQNFFKDIYQVHSKDIFGYDNISLQIITTKSTYVFDLTKDNILEL